MTRKAKTCFIYVRVSTKMQVENGESIEAQLYDLRQYAKRENLRILHEYIDDGYSGKNITGRPHFQEMMEEIKSGVHVDYVLVFKLSRFGRNAADALSSLQFMQDYGTNLVCVKDGINSEAQMGKMMIAFMSAFAEMERENILVQTMAGREQKAREGKWNGGQAPFGYRLVKDEKGKGHLEIDEDEAEIVRIIFREYTKNGKGVHAIASWLNTQGYRKKIRGNSKYEHFAPGTVKNIIRNPVYAGKIAFGRRRTTPVKGERNVYHMVKQDNFDIYEGEHEAIIDEATWNAAQKRLAEDSHPFPEAKPDGHTHLLTGMLVCPVCERNMIANVSRGKRKKDGTIGKTTYAYTCKYSKKQFGHDCTFTRQFKQEYIDREVIEVISRAAHSAVFEERVREELDAAVDIEKLEADVARIGKALENNGAARRMLSRQLDALDASDRSYERKYEDMQARLDKLYDESADIEDALDAAEAKLESAKEKQVTTARVYEMLDEFQEKFDTYDPAKQKEILQQVVERVEIDPDANPKKGDAIVKRVRFKCPVSFYRTLPEEAYDVLGINEFNRLETTEYTPDGNSRVDGNHDDTVYIGRSLLHNNSNVDQVMTTQSFQETVTDTVSTSTTHGMGTSITATSSFSIPFTGSTDIAMTASYNFSQNTTETSSKAVTIKVEPQRVTVPANSSVEVRVFLNKASISGNVLLKGDLVGTETGEITIQANNAFWGWIFADSESYSIDMAQMAKEYGQSMGVETNSDGSVKIVGKGTYEASIGADLVVQVNNLTSGETGSTVLEGIPVSDKSGATEYPSEVQYQSLSVIDEGSLQQGSEDDTAANERCVTILKDANYQGASQKLGVGTHDFNDFGAVGNDALSSIIVPSGMKAILYENANKIGLYQVATSSMDFSRLFLNDRISLIEVIDLEANENASSESSSSNTSSSAEETYVTLFKDDNFHGSSKKLLVGEGTTSYTAADFKMVGDNNLSSLRVPAGVKVILYENSNFTGKQKIVTSDTDLYRDGSGFNDKTSAIKILRA